MKKTIIILMFMISLTGYSQSFPTEQSVYDSFPIIFTQVKDNNIVSQLECDSCVIEMQNLGYNITKVIADTTIVYEMDLHFEVFQYSVSVKEEDFINTKIYKL